MIRRPLQRAIAKDDLNDVPDDTRWADAVVSGTNESLQQLSRFVDNGISIQSNTNSEVVEFDVTVPDPWIGPTSYAHSVVGPPVFAGQAAGYQSVGWRQHWDGTIELRGAVANATGFNPFVTFSQKMAPRSEMKLPASGDGTGVPGVIRITTDGKVGTLLAPGVGNIVSLDGIRYSPADMTPQPASCWPIPVKTKMTSKPMAVLVLDAQNKNRSTVIRPPSPTQCAWDYVKASGAPTIRVLDMGGLAPNNTYRVRLLVIGE